MEDEGGSRLQGDEAKWKMLRGRHECRPHLGEAWQG